MRPKGADEIANSLDSDQTYLSLHSLIRPVCLNSYFFLQYLICYTAYFFQPIIE